ADDLVSASHDLSEGGLGQTLAELAIHAGKGLDVDLSEVHADLFTALFSESASRIVVATGHGAELVKRAEALGIPVTKLGSTNASGVIAVRGADVAVELSVAELEAAWSKTLPEAFGHAVGANAVVE
ncbi:MAG: phosphoribosylformylglycinamidine synthase subunit PurL, partial [Corynebacterium sp.]|nr:phosphoribosylformylglycinamidine synthase subunit PurL [Corynebacterium sp.]